MAHYSNVTQSDTDHIISRCFSRNESYKIMLACFMNPTSDAAASQLLSLVPFFNRLFDSLSTSS